MKKIIYILLFLFSAIPAFSQGVVKNVGAKIKVWENANVIVRDANFENIDLTGKSAEIETSNNSNIIVEQNFTNRGSIIINANSFFYVHKNFTNSDIVDINEFGYLVVFRNVINSGAITNSHIIEIGE